MTLPKTRFTDHLIRLNGLAACGFARWAFVPGMAFGSPTQWWADGGQRERPHEGIDLCLYLDRQGELRRLQEGVRLPAMYGGTVVRLCDDFLGRSVMIECDWPGRTRWYTMYGHTTPELDIRVGQTVQEGEVVARLAPLPPHKSYILPHLHVSFGWAPGAVPPDRLDWETVPDVLALVDPVRVLYGEPASISTATWPALLRHLQ
jgi:murein DD-endopeptidase MepM/ murein hydrolase activator NlpD